jgi:Fibronectin type III domain
VGTKQTLAHGPRFAVRREPGRRRKASRGLSVTFMLAAGLSAVTGGASLHPAVAAASGAAPLQAAAGQYFPSASAQVLDTPANSSPWLAAGATTTFQVTGIGSVPASGVSDVYMVVQVLAPQVAGCVDVYDADASDPGLCTATFDANHNASVGDIVPVSSSGEVSVTNESTGNVELIVDVLGYFQDGTGQAAGDTFVPLVQQPVIAQQQIPAGGSWTVQVSGKAGIASDAVGAALSIGANSATTNGCLSVFAAGAPANDVGQVCYYSGHTFHGLYFGALSSSGQLTIVNNGTKPVTASLDSEGSLISPTGSEIGSTYLDVPQAAVENTSTPLAAGASVTFQVTGVADIPSSGVSAVAENIRAVGPTNTGYLATYAGGGSANGVAVNFYAHQNGGSNLTVPILSSAGQQTVTNNSTGPVDVIVTVLGYFLLPGAPPPPGSVTASASGGAATVSWSAPQGDGGAPITSYTVTASPDSATVTVAGNTEQATLSNLASAPLDSFTVTATNAAGQSVGSTFTPPQAITGQVTAPSGAPVAGDQVTLVTNSDDPSPAPVTPSVLGTAVTGANGDWSFTVPSYASLPADAQAAAAANGGYLNVDAVVMGTATVSGANYELTGVGVQSVWVGSPTQTQLPAPADLTAPPAMVLRPDGADVSAQYTAAAQAATWASQNDPAATDSSGDITGDPTNAGLPAPTDAYGYQEVVPLTNYNPNVAADGTDLTNAPVTPAGSSADCCVGTRLAPGCYDQQTAVDLKTNHFTVIGEYHTGWRTSGDLSYAAGASSNIGSYVSFDGGEFSFNGYDTFESEKKLSSGIGTAAGVDNDSRQVLINLKYWETSWEAVSNARGTVCSTWKQWDEKGLYQPPAGSYIEAGPNMFGTLSKADIKANALWRTDGIAGLNNLIYNSPSHIKWLSNEQCGWHTDLTNGQGVTYGVAATVGGVGIQAETSHSSAVDQSVDTRGWTCQERYDDYKQVHDSKHWVWGYDKALIDFPKTFPMY